MRTRTWKLTPVAWVLLAIFVIGVALSALSGNWYIAAVLLAVAALVIAGSVFPESLSVGPQSRGGYDRFDERVEHADDRWKLD